METKKSNGNGGSDLAQTAANQLKQLDLESKLPTKPSAAGGPTKKVRSGSVPRQPIKSTTQSGQTSGATSPEHLNKKLPMNRISVGLAPSPNVSKATSKIGSLANTSYKPSGGKVKIENNKIPQFKANATSKIGSMANVKHQPGGGTVKIPLQKVEIKSSSRIGSLSNVRHTPGGGDKKIFDDKDYLLKTRSPTSNSPTATQEHLKSKDSSRRASHDSSVTTGN